MKLKTAVVLGAIWATSLAAMAQWQWVDKDGRKVYSDRPPPADVPEKNILKQPGGARPAGAAPAAPPSSEGAATATAPPAAAASRPLASAPGSSKDKELEEKKAQAEAAQAARKKAEDDKLAKAKAENCVRARAAKTDFETGKPIAQVNAQGERIILDGPARAAEAKRIDGIVASDCMR